jgi:hypothetical protein
MILYHNTKTVKNLFKLQAGRSAVRKGYVRRVDMTSKSSFYVSCAMPFRWSVIAHKSSKKGKATALTDRVASKGAC